MPYLLAMSPAAQRVTGIVVLLVLGVLTLPIVAYFVDGDGSENWIIVVAQQRPRDTVAEDRIGPFSTEEQCIEALESEVDFKAKSLQRLGNAVSAVRSSTSWNLRATTASGPETGQLTVQTTYSCVPA